MNVNSKSITPLMLPDLQHSGMLFYNAGPVLAGQNPLGSQYHFNEVLQATIPSKAFC